MSQGPLPDHLYKNPYRDELHLREIRAWLEGALGHGNNVL